MKAPKIGSYFPSEIEAEILISLKDLPPIIKAEWLALKPNEIFYLVGFDKNWEDSKKPDPFASRLGIKIVRGA